jgi:hypothetical protein
LLAVHIATGILVLATNLGAGTWGGVAWIRNVPTVGFWYLLRIAQVAVVLQIAFGSILLLLGHQAGDNLHYLYGILPLPVALFAELARAGVSERELEGLDFDSLPKDRQRLVVLAIARRETGIMAVACLVVFLLGLRAVGTS